MPNNDAQFPSLADQLRWKRELEISRYLAEQGPGGFFPGPGAAAAEDLYAGNTERAPAPANDNATGTRPKLSVLQGGKAGTGMGGKPGGESLSSGFADMATKGPEGPAGALGKRPGARLQEARAKGGSGGDMALRMGGAAGAEAAQGVGKAFGPKGEVVGAAVAEGLTGGVEGAIAAKDFLKGGPKAGAAGFKKLIDTYGWPMVMDAISGTGLIVLTGIEAYWIASKLSFPGTVKTKFWEDILVPLLMLFETILIIAVLAIFGLMSCMQVPTCAYQAGKAIGADVLRELVGI